MKETVSIFRKHRLCIVIPTYNNEKTIEAVVKGASEYCAAVMVVNDGSTDATPSVLRQLDDRIIRVGYPKNKGKGFALKVAFQMARTAGYDYALTMDADGQHKAEDLAHFAEALEKHPDTLLLGSRSLHAENMPQKNTFANKFSNFWFTVQTACRLPDTQTGFRVYPLKKMKNMHPVTNRYEAELDMLVRCRWRGIPIVPVAVNVYYPPENDRVSHFRPFADFFRISLLNTLLCLLAIVYGYPSMLIHLLFKK